jgi:hypothetical protein
LATFVSTPVSLETARLAARRPQPARDRVFAAWLTGALSAFAIAVHGYHPYAEDGGLYMAGVKRLLDPSLYPHETSFVVEHLRFSLFAPMVAELARAAGLLSGTTPMQSLPSVLLGLHGVSIWLTLFAAWLLAARCFASRMARVGAVALLACWLGLPVAGTSLILMDPYVTARSFSTPCMILMLVGVLDLTNGTDSEVAVQRRGFALCVGALAGAALMHPLMAAYAMDACMVLGCLRARQSAVRVWGTLALCASEIALATGLQAIAPAESPDYIRIAMTRPYWFLSSWYWYEVVGLLAPMAILMWAQRRPAGAHPRDASQALARMGILVGATACMVALRFARADASTHLVARLQPLRALQTVYIVMILTPGGLLAERALHRRVLRWATALLLLGGIMVAAERMTYPGSQHVEGPWASSRAESRNPWVQAFLWIHNNTPKDALFALDPDYISQPAEDAQGFRALAERSALPDYSKDGGEASITPALTESWTLGQAAQAHLSAPTTTDSERTAKLRPLGVDWIVLRRGAVTGLSCPFANAEVRVCRLP